MIAVKANSDARDTTFFTVVCRSDVYHSPADRWPDAVDGS
jgi:hypothetical protein